MKQLVNLDALIPRQDMGRKKKNPVAEAKETAKFVSHTELRFEANTYQVLRKPDFQRETSSWSPEKVCELIEAYVTESLVPAIILWRSPSNDLFVIDGAHRLSSLIAWIQNDYGDGERSKAFFDEIGDAQKKAADKARDLVNARVGPWKEISVALDPANSKSKYKLIAKVLNNCDLTVQPLLTPHVAQAEKSFFKINEQGVPLSDSDKIILHSRECPNAIAARAINQKGTGHPFWGKFPEARKKSIEKRAKEIYKLMFHPPGSGRTIKGDNKPIAGRYTPGTALGLLLQTANLANRVPDFVPSSKDEAELRIPKDASGVATEEYLKKINHVVTTICNRDDTDFMRSLDLHPLIYFYSDKGNHQPTAFLAVVEMIASWQHRNDLFKFTANRKRFEQFLLDHRDFLTQIGRITRGQLKAVHTVKLYYETVISQIDSGIETAKIVGHLQQMPEFLALKTPLRDEDEEDLAGENFSPATKSQINIDHLLETSRTCKICLARIPSFAVSSDHKRARSDKGKGSTHNHQDTHHYCNSAKNVLLPYLEQRGRGKFEAKPRVR